MPTNTEILARYVAARREDLHMSQEDVALAGGPSTTTLSKIEAAAAGVLRKRTLEDLDRALMWRIGSSREVLVSGRAPEPVDPEPRADRPLDVEDLEVSLVVRATEDGRGRVVTGVLADPVRGDRLELRYWAPAGTSVSMGEFGGVVADAYGLARDTLRAGTDRRAAMSDQDYTLAARDVDDDDEAERQQDEP